LREQEEKETKYFAPCLKGFQKFSDRYYDKVTITYIKYLQVSCCAEVSCCSSRGQLLRFQVQAHGKFTRSKQKEKITTKVWFYQGWALQMGAGLEKNIQ
jgi:hypothetical protein